MFNFTEFWQNIPVDFARKLGNRQFHDALSEAKVSPSNNDIQIPPYGRVWLVNGPVKDKKPTIGV